MLESRLGILGGGQLGAMLIQEAISLGIPVSVLESDPNAPCAHYCQNFVVGDPLDFDQVMEFGRGVDLITIEKEGVNVAALKALRDGGKKIFPAPEIIEMVQDKFVQKTFLQSLGLPVVPGVHINNKSELYSAIKSFPVCLKLCREGYDGRGVLILREAADVENAFDAPSLLEDFVDLDQELAVLVARKEDGEVITFDPVSMVFDPEKNILDYQLCPALVSDYVRQDARQLAREVAEKTELVGLIAVEMFLAKNGDLLVNELAPRPHNSGHHTIEACPTSQYAQLLRAIYGLPFGNADFIVPSAMINIIGKAEMDSPLPGRVHHLLSMDNVYIHRYGKKERPGRKLGHATVLAASLQEVKARAVEIRDILNA